MSPVCVGAVQAEPVWFDLQGTVEKTVSLIEQAAAKGVQVLAFPEVWISGYPWIIWSQGPFDTSRFATEYMNSSLERDSPEMRRIQKACKEHSIFVVLGYSEKDMGSLYISQAFIDTNGDIIHNRRKIKPTNVERSVWGDGQADSLQTVVDTPFGRVGALNCWEHFQPLLRYYEYVQGVQIHVASWPPMTPRSKDVSFDLPWNVTAEASYRATQFLAMEGQTFALCSTQIVSQKNHEVLGIKDKGFFNQDDGGFAMIFGPDGAPLADPLPSGAEGIVTADIDLQSIDYAKHLCDPVGHYSRPDLLSLNVNSTAAKQVHYSK